MLLVPVVLLQITCNQAILTAPPGSEMTLFANPLLVPSNGGVSVISAIVIEAIGTPVADGTVVQFFTNLGVVDEQGKTNDGVARVNLRANGRSGVARVTAFTGGGSAPTTPPTTTGAAPFGAAAASAAAATAFVEVTIGNAGARSILLTADPPFLTVSRTSQIRANVFDATGNPLPGVAVFFNVESTENTTTPPPTTTPSSTLPPSTSPIATMDSGGRPQFTDGNGQAFDVLRFRDVTPARATVQARVAAGGEGDVFITGTVTVEIDPR
jgi:hypothetical protein